MASAGRLQEAEKHLAEAAKCLKTSFLKWNPDYGSAASSYDKAAVCYRNAREYKKAKEAYLKAAECHYSNNAIYHAGKSTEMAANVARDGKDLEESASLFKQASVYYNESGHPDSAGQTIVKGAQLLQHDNPVLAANYFLETAAYYELDDKYREAANSVKNAVRMYCRTRPRQYDEIIKKARLSRKSFLTAGAVNLAHEAIAVEILATLMQGRAIDAVDILQEANSVQEFASSQDRTVLEELVDAINQQDMETVQQCCSSGIFKSMDPEYAKLARDLALGGDSTDPARKAKGGSTQPVKKLETKDIKKKPSELANMRSQLFSKSTGDSSSSKKSRTKTGKASSYQPPPPAEEKKPEPTAIPFQGRGLEDQPINETTAPNKEDKVEGEAVETGEGEGKSNQEEEVAKEGGGEQDGEKSVESDQGEDIETEETQETQEGTPDREEGDEDEPIDIN